ARRGRQRGVAEVAADPVLRTAPRAGPGTGVAGRAVEPRAVRREVERRGPPGAADPSGGRRRPLALMTRQTTRRRGATGEVEPPAGPRGEGSAHVTGGAVASRGRVIELDAGGERRVRGSQQRRLGPLRRVAGDAGIRRERRSRVGEVAADPVLSAAPRAGPRSGVAGRAVQSRAVRRVVEGRALVGRAPPAGGRGGPLALVAGNTARRR